MLQTSPGFLIGLDEAEVRRLCGEATFTRADALQRDGHVLAPAVQGGALWADVRGTWRRIDRATVTAQAGKLVSSCSCGAPGFCRHAGAVLLQGLRDRSSLVDVLETQKTATGQASGQAQPRLTSPVEELAELLEGDLLPHLREIARRRGLSTSGRGKADLVRALAPALATPAGVDDALAAVGAAGCRALVAIHLLQAVGRVTDQDVRRGYRALGGTDSSLSMDALLDLGLLLVIDPRQSYTPPSYRVPRVVASRLPTLLDLARRYDQPDPPERAHREWIGGRLRLGIDELLQIVGLEVASGQLLRPGPVYAEWSGYLPVDWEIDPDDVPVGVHPNQLLQRQQGLRLLPAQRLLAHADASRLATKIGQTSEIVSFAARLLHRLEILEVTNRLCLHENGLQSLLDLAPQARLSSMAHAWLSLTDWSELALVVGKSGPLQLRWRLSYYRGLPLLVPETVRARQLVASVVGRMAPHVWYDFPSFLGRLHGLAPRLLAQDQEAAGHMNWWLADAGQEPERLSAKTTVDWPRLRAAIVAAILTGPLTWLGLVDVLPGPEGPLAFRVRPSAGVLVEREIPELEAPGPATLVVGPDLTVLVPAGGTETRVHVVLSQAGDLVEASAEGLRYRLSLEKVRVLYDGGATGPGLIHFLADRSRAPLPETVHATLRRWWEGYGTLRLYDDLTVIELGDDFLLTELLAATSLRSHLIHAFSPRLIAVDPTAAAQVVAELVRLGHAPRVVEEP